MTVPDSIKAAAIAADVARMIRQRVERAARKPAPRYAPVPQQRVRDRVFAS